MALEAARSKHPAAPQRSKSKLILCVLGSGVCVKCRSVRRAAHCSCLRLSILLRVLPCRLRLRLCRPSLPAREGGCQRVACIRELLELCRQLSVLAGRARARRGERRDVQAAGPLLHLAQRLLRPALERQLHAAFDQRARLALELTRRPLHKARGRKVFIEALPPAIQHVAFRIVRWEARVVVERGVEQAHRYVAGALNLLDAVERCGKERHVRPKVDAGPSKLVDVAALLLERPQLDARLVKL
mmetsp:Transcript_28330/g.83882  ORF Transcript_28330/g.83882 Transcript_28330/m.83882 type:complete len:244 (+) Transcript_28330:389-1120(+)